MPKRNNSYYLTSTDFNFRGKIVLLRVDCDVDLKKEEGKLVVDEDFRLKSVIPTIHFLKDREASRIIFLGHLGRPGGKKVAELSLRPVADWLKEQKIDAEVLENLRFNPGEKVNDNKFAEKLAKLGDVFINDAFGSSHRKHASIVSLPKLLPSFLGLRFEAEIRSLSWVKKKAKRPLVFVLGGSKKGKIDYIPFLADWSDHLLVGGKLPLLMQKPKIPPATASSPASQARRGGLGHERAGKNQNENPKCKIGRLNNSSKDIDQKTIEEFVQVIARAATIIWAGPMGVYEEKENRRGTFEVAKAIAKRKVFKLAGGGDTHRVLSWLKLWDKFDFVSTGGGAMLQFLKDETLPGVEAVKI